MPIYVENPDKLNLQISDSQIDVIIKVNCYCGTRTTVAFESGYAKCKKSVVIGKASELKGQTVLFSGSAYNALDNNIRVKHTIQEENGNELIYIFPDDYAGNPEYPLSDENPTYEFTVNFE
jgi:hypothetical protein